MKISELYESRWIESPRLDVSTEGNSKRVFFTAKLKKDHRRDWDKDEVAVEATVDLDKPVARINQINAWMSHRSLGQELLSHILFHLKKNGYKKVTAYTERFNFNPQSMVKRLGAVETGKTEHGVTWEWDLEA